MTHLKVVKMNMYLRQSSPPQAKNIIPISTTHQENSSRYSEKKGEIELSPKLSKTNFILFNTHSYMK